MKEPKYGDLRISYHPHYDTYMIDQYTRYKDENYWTSYDHPIKVYQTLYRAKYELDGILSDRASKARPCVYYYPPDYEETT